MNFVWYETGTYLVMRNGQMFHLPTKKMQQEAAFMSNYSRIFNTVSYQLFSPVDGHELTADELYKKQYNLHKCVLCSNIDMCNGCSSCGACDSITLTDLSGIMRARSLLVHKNGA